MSVMQYRYMRFEHPLYNGNLLNHGDIAGKLLNKRESGPPSEKRAQWQGKSLSYFSL